MYFTVRKKECFAPLLSIFKLFAFVSSHLNWMWMNSFNNFHHHFQQTRQGCFVSLDCFARRPLVGISDRNGWKRLAFIRKISVDDESMMITHGCLTFGGWECVHQQMLTISSLAASKLRYFPWPNAWKCRCFNAQAMEMFVGALFTQ